MKQLTNYFREYFLILAMTCAAAIPAQAQQEPNPAKYHPFVEAGKMWRVHNFTMGGRHTVTDYSFDKSATAIGDKEYYALTTNAVDTGEARWLFREEDRRVYIYYEATDTEVCAYDFNLTTGDTFTLDTDGGHPCTVIDTGTRLVNGEALRTITFRITFRVDDENAIHETMEWTEGVGCTSSPVDGLYMPVPTSETHFVAYVLSGNGETYLPFAFEMPYNGWYGQPIEKRVELPPVAHEWEDGDVLQYELVPQPDGDWFSSYYLHVSGVMWLQCGPNNYIYCTESAGEDNSHRTVRLMKEELEPLTDCVSPYVVDLYFPYFRDDVEYTAIDDRGGHIVQCAADYRPFIEEGKEWRVARYSGMDNSVQEWKHATFGGDTIVDELPCRKVECLHLTKDERWSEYAGAVHEAGRRVWYAQPGAEHLALLYDFTGSVGDTLDVYNGFWANTPLDSIGHCITLGNAPLEQNQYKGVRTYIAFIEQREQSGEQREQSGAAYSPMTWLQAVGGRTPLVEIMPTGLNEELISCTVGDEVLYDALASYHPEIIDDITPNIGDEVKRQWLDFTHTTKPRPKAPRRAAADTSDDTPTDTEADAPTPLSGQYSERDLHINLQPLHGTYTITLTDAAGRAVYTKQVQTSQVVALETTLSAYEEGTYSLAIENEGETFTASLSLVKTGIRDLTNPNITASPFASKCFDLSGREIVRGKSGNRYLQRGVYVQGRQKFVVR